MQMTKQKKHKGTMIRIDCDVRQQLGEIGHYGETLSDIIKRLIAEHYELEKLKAK